QFPELRLNLQAAHLRHTNIHQRNCRTMNLRITQELFRIAKRFRFQISGREKPTYAFKYGGIIV
ncbi:MAG TPA: hypothetical protein VFU09_06250, partial [Candidatus Udaeobacter sp.]|nr:hypothetical protein [Candidatus Udaeobacter sp.]